MKLIQITTSRCLLRRKTSSTNSFRNLSTDSKLRDQSTQINHHNKILQLNQNSAIQLKFHTTWLRHQCRCSACFNGATFQTNVKISPKLLQTTLQKAELIQSNLVLNWDDGHKTEYKLDWLEKKNVSYFTQFIWSNALSQIQDRFKPANLNLPDFNGEFMQDAIDFKHFMSNENALVQILKKLVTHGFGVVTNAPADITSTETVVNRVTHMQRTMFSEGSCLVSSDHELEHKDTAYTSEALGCHTDTTYFTEPMGLEVFHCLHHDGEGGLSSFTDGWYAAQLLYQQKPESYKMLSTTPVLFEYFDAEKHHYSAIDTILTHNKFNGLLERVRFNTADMVSPLYIPLESLTKCYESMYEYANILNSITKWMKLNPGTIIFFDNWRILHGRSAFTGNRKFATIYLGRSDWLSKARILGVV